MLKGAFTVNSESSHSIIGYEVHTINFMRHFRDLQGILPSLKTSCEWRPKFQVMNFRFQVPSSELFAIPVCNAIVTDERRTLANVRLSISNDEEEWPVFTGE